MRMTGGYPNILHIITDEHQAGLMGCAGHGQAITPHLDRLAREGVRDVAVTENLWSKALRWKQRRFVHYQPEMFEGRDVGELYDLAADPDETTNLYHAPDYL